MHVTLVLKFEIESPTPVLDNDHSISLCVILNMKTITPSNLLAYPRVDDPTAQKIATKTTYSTIQNNDT